MGTLTGCILKMVIAVILTAMQTVLLLLYIIKGDWKWAAVNVLAVALCVFVARTLFVSARTIEAIIVLKIKELEEKRQRHELEKH